MGAPLVDIVAAARMLEAGATIGFPTDTVWGIGCLLDTGTERIFDIKQRDPAKPLQVLVPDLATARSIGEVSEAAEELLATSATVVVRALRPMPELGGDGTTVGLRIPAHPRLLELMRAVGPLIATSANLSGEPELRNASEVSALHVDAVFDVEPAPNGVASDVFDATVDPVRVLRKRR